MDHGAQSVTVATWENEQITDIRMNEVMSGVEYA